MKDTIKKQKIIDGLYDLREYMNEALPLFEDLREAEQNRKEFSNKTKTVFLKIIFFFTLLFSAWSGYIFLIEYLLKIKFEYLEPEFYNFYTKINVFNNIEFLLLVFAILYFAICYTKEKNSIKKYRKLYQEESKRYQEISNELLKYYNKYPHNTPVVFKYCHPVYITDFIRELNEDNDLTLEDIQRKIAK